ncbi:hypothetical protein HMPREF1411_01534 [Helicobacter pylori GAM250AFi]|nr:hypothetical protein HMPREF1411_01534 [Helicobacter pylori GAM250AFi]EMH12675.1 hypothetical protein HMPREF1414_01422 [Helicobacter pylori GAM252T]EMH12842.1 hypothetical protein HMPREF1413_01453 [Helicobacter pylori GAM252Bi]EMH13036.1 hypothetical protein HMPREF1412_01129 [Helicobacter pylori GAM250T]EMH46834.1 hypothetical protein HMPREF1439_01236 [Helicobacter pylori HP250AFiii]EMH50172.1 hypothetical protein HMPREF1440_01446 [Helicobacter pylori HP250AFiV]EMH52128.1 hypothetical prote
MIYYFSKMSYYFINLILKNLDFTYLFEYGKVLIHSFVEIVVKCVGIF